MPDTTRSTYHVVIVALAPAVLAVSLVGHPYLSGRLPNDTEVAEAVVDSTTRWGLVHLAASVASGLVILAFLAIRSYLRDAGDDRLSAVGVPFVVIGSTLFAILPGMEFAPLAAAESGADIVAAQAALQDWFVPVLVIGALSFAIGVLAFIRGIMTSRIMNAQVTAVVVGGLAVMALSRFVPFAAVQFYVQSAGAVVGLWPLAYQMWRQPTAQPPAAQTHVAPAT